MPNNEIPDYAVPADIPDYAEPIPEEKQSGLSKIWDAANKPIVDLRGSPYMKQATDLFQQQHPILGAIGNFATDTLSSLTSPLSLGLGATDAAANIAARVGSSKLATALHTPGKIAAGGMVAHGGYNALGGKDWPTRIGGAAEAGLGYLGVKSPISDVHATEVHTSEIPHESAPVNEVNPIENVKPEIPPIKIPETVQAPKEELKIPEYAVPVSDEPAPEVVKSSEVIKPEVVDEDFEKGKELGRLLQRLSTGQSLGPTEVSSLYKGPDLKVSVRDPKKQIPISQLPELQQPTTDAVTKLMQALSLGNVGRNIQDELYSSERGKRIAQASSVKTPGAAGFYQQLGLLKGELPKVDLEKLKLGQNDIDALIDGVTNAQMNDWQKINAKMGLMKLVGGVTPQRSEIKLLGQVFGPDFENTVMLHGGFGAIPSDARRIINETANFSKSMMASMDFSAPLRQGLPLIGRKEYWNAFKQMWHYGGSEEFYHNEMQSLHERPLYELGENSGLKLTDIGDDLTRREEAFMGTWAEHIPGVRASERMYVGFLNKLRADTFDNLVYEAASLGHKDISKQIAKFVNTSTGRGDLGRLEKVGVELNSVLFSPRMIASRLTMLNPNYYIKADPFVRKQALKALFSVAAAGSTFTTLGVAAGGRTSLDPTSADYMKLRIGNTRMDPFGGFQQYIVFAKRIINGMQNSQDVTPIIKQFAENKLSPILSLADTLMKGKAALPPGGVGGAISNNRPTAEIINRVVPMLAGDLLDVYKDDPNLLPLGILGAGGMGMQTYTDKMKSGFRLR